MSFQYPPRDPQTTATPPPGPPSEPHYMPVRLPQNPPVVTYALLAITVAVYGLQVLTQALYHQDIPAMLGMKVNVLIMAGQWWRLFTPMFLHGGIFHIGFNMYALYVLGPSLERFYGGWRFLLLYLVAGFAGNVFSFAFSNYNSLGASTAIFGLLGAQGVFLYQHRDLFGQGAQRSLINIIFIAVVNLVIGLSPGIDNWGHVGGLIGGTLFAWFGGPKLDVVREGFELRLVNVRPSWVTVATTLIIMALFTGMAVAIR